MQKQKVTLPTMKWGSLNSKYLPESKYVSNDEFTAGSYNFITNVNGAIEKRPTDVQYNSTALVNNGKDQFEAIFANGIHHLLFLDGGTLKYTTGDGILSSAKTGYTATASMEYSMYQNRVYLDNGVDNPSVYDLTASYGGVTSTPPQVKDMGAYPPVSAVTFAADSAGGNVPTGGHFYQVTFLYYDLEESNGGPSSVLHTVSGGNQTVNLTAVPIGGYGVTARNIYRDNNDGTFLLVGTISNNTATTFTDTVSSGTTAIPTSNNLPPIFSYIALNLSRLFVAGVPGTPTTLYWSLPDFPDIFDPNNFIVCNPKDPITALAVYQGTLYVFNRHSLGTITGLTDDTFAYQEFPGSVGCVDNRSIQIRTIDGVPVLVWLSDRGFYKCNGSTVEYISDKIEDLVNLNIQQATFVSGSNTQSTLADFAAGTASPGIDLATNPGTITTLDPESIYQSQTDWDGGLSLVNVATKDGTNSLKVPTLFAPSLASGALAGSATISGSNVVLPTGSSGNFSVSIAPKAVDGALSPFAYYGLPQGHPGNPTKYAQQITVPVSGTIASLKTYQSAGEDSGSSFGSNYVVSIYSDVLGNPGVSLWSSSFSKGIVSGTYNSQTFSPALVVAPGTYWILTERTSPASTSAFPASVATNSDSHVGVIKVFVSGSWISVASNSGSANIWRVNNFTTVQQVGPAPVTLPFDLTFTQTPVAESGTWSSPVYDSFSSSVIAANVVNSGSYPAGCSGTLFVDASNDPTLSTGVTVVSFANPNGTNAVATTNLRYWRLRYSIATTDNTQTPSVNAPILTFNTTATWISQPINCTTDVTGYNAIVVTENLPLGTTATITIATSANNITYTGFTSIGSAVVQQWVKVMVVLTATSDDVTSPSVSLLKFTWNLTSTFTSSIINIGQVPSGWGVFQNQSSLNGGTLTFYMRSASSSGAIPGATFHVVSNGVFPDTLILPLQFTQWKIVFTSAPASLPTVDSVTVNWFLGSGQSTIRVASLFFNKTYFLAAAEVGSLTNNIVIVYDFEGNWRVFRDVNINSLGLFYNQPFYFDAIRKDIYQWLIAPTGTGTSIVMDVRLKAFDLGDINHLKVVRSLRLTGLNTGTTFHVYYSVDRGTTWTEMLNVDGVLGYTTTTDGNKFSQYFVPTFIPGQNTSGNTIMFRVTSLDAFPAVIMTLEPVLYVRSGKYLEEPI